jgi:hypothetical protein
VFDGRRTAVLRRAGTGSGVGEQRIPVGLSREAPFAAAGVDRRNRAARATARIGGDHLALRAISPRAAIAASGSAPRAAATRPKAASRALGSVIRNTAGGVVQRDRMPALQDVSETTLLCTTQSGHPGARRTTAEDRHEGDDAQRAPVMPGVPGAGIGAVVEGGQE